MFSSLLLLLPISVLMAALIGAAFWWAIFAGQFDDSDSRGRSILLDDDATDAVAMAAAAREAGEHPAHVPQRAGQQGKSDNGAAMAPIRQHGIPD